MCGESAGGVCFVQARRREWPASSRLRETYPESLTDEEETILAGSTPRVVRGYRAAGGARSQPELRARRGSSEFLARCLRSTTALMRPAGRRSRKRKPELQVAAEAKTLARALARVPCATATRRVSPRRRGEMARSRPWCARSWASWRGRGGGARASPRSRRASRRSRTRPARRRARGVCRGTSRESASGSRWRPRRCRTRGARSARGSRARRTAARVRRQRERRHRPRARGNSTVGRPRAGPKTPRNGARLAPRAATRHRLARGLGVKRPAEAARELRSSPSTSRGCEASSSSLSLRPEGETDADADDAALANASRAEDDEDIEPWGGSDAGSDEVMWLGESELEDAAASFPRVGPRARRARRPPSRGGRTSADDPLDRRETEPEDVSTSLWSAPSPCSAASAPAGARTSASSGRRLASRTWRSRRRGCGVFLRPDRAPGAPPRAEPAAQPQLRHAAARARVLRARIGVRGDGASRLASLRNGTKRNSAPVGSARSRRAPRRRRQRGVRRAACGARSCAASVAAQRTRRRGARERGAPRCGAGRVHGQHHRARA